MQSIKLSVTCRRALTKKYDASAMKRIDAALARWIAADAARGIKTVHVALDDAKSMKTLKVAPITGRVTAPKVKRALDTLVAKLSPDYVVLLGATDVIPQFEVPNPTRAQDGEPIVPTDNPYASSQKFSASRRASYLIPDRVVGRIPDLPSSADPAWLLDYLSAAEQWKSRASTSYEKDLLVCADTWKGAGRECVSYLSRDAATLMLCPPSGDASDPLRARHGTLLQMIKCHGAPNDSRFYGQKGSSFPEVLRSTSIVGRTNVGTVVGAMCCFGASVFDPRDPTASHAGEPPIPSVYLRQGAFGFLGSTSTAWVGPTHMVCADWVVSAFLKSILSGASLGRGALEAKQGYVRWIQQQGDAQDSTDDKTLVQFVLLGDPSIHPVQAATPAAIASASLLGAVPAASAVMARRQRRATSNLFGAMLRTGLPERRAIRSATAPAGVAGLARELMDGAGDGFRFDVSRPHVEQVTSRILEPRLPLRAGPAIVAGARVAGPAQRKSLQYSWAAERKEGPVREIKVVSIQADGDGNLLRSKVLLSS